MTKKINKNEVIALGKQIINILDPLFTKKDPVDCYEALSHVLLSLGSSFGLSDMQQKELWDLMVELPYDEDEK
jgi:phage terminase small subunit